jgi:predicted nucleic acid-binding protein
MDAAIAIENNLILANDDKHFDRIEDLRQEKW